jgi:CRP-like cAMP-binding protein
MKRTDIARIQDAAIAGRIAETLTASGPFAGIAVETLAQVVKAGSLIELANGEALVREGEAATPEVYLLIEGALIVQSKGAQLARLTRTGDVIGETAVLLSSKRTADVLAEGAVRVVAVPAQALTQPEFADVAAGVRSAMLRDDWVQY